MTILGELGTIIKSKLDTKVDKVSGKGLSTEDYSTAEKTKLAGIAAGAEVNVNADWNATSGDAQILNKPTTLNGYGITDAYTKTEVQTALPKVGFDLNNVTTPGIGQMAWNSTEGTVDLALNGAVLQIGQEQLIRVRNNTSGTISNGSAVMATGTLGNSGRITVANANLTSANAKYILGIATEDIAAGADGFVTTFGKIRGINTTGSQYGETWVDGDVIYVKDSGNGALTKVVPLDTQVKLPIAIVINAHATNGTIFTRVNSIDENHAKAELATKQATLVSGTNIKTINGNSLLGSGDISTIQTTITGNAGTATKLLTARNIAGVSFDGSADINIPFANLSSKPTTVNGYGITDAYTKTQTDSAISTAVANLVNSAPSTLDTLGEIATQLANDESVVNALITTVGNKVDKVTGKGLSTNDFTNAYKTQLDGLQSALDAKVDDYNIGTSEFNTGITRGGKIVYGIEVDLGTLPNTTKKDVAFTFNSSYTYWIDASQSYSMSSTETITLPYVGYIGDEVSVKLDRANNKITIIAAKDRTSFTTSKLVLLYTK